MSKGGLLDLQQVTAAAKSLGEKSENGDNKVVLRYKVAVFGSAGAGKTATIATLCHRPAPEQHIETPGIQISRLVWPLSAASEAQDAQAEHEETVAKNSTFVLDFWDCGFSALTRFDYLHENMLHHADAALFVVSACDRPSFLGLQRTISRTLQERRSSIVTFVFFTHVDEPFNVEVLERDRKEFDERQSANMLVESICNVPLTHETPNRCYASLIAPKVDRLCQRLLAHDQVSG